MKHSGPREIDSTGVDLMISKLENYFRENRGSKVCLIFGQGGHPKRFYQEFKETAGVILCLSYSCLTGVGVVLRPILPSYAGVIKIIEPSLMGDVFNRVAESSMVSVYIFDKKYEDDFINFIRSKPHPNKINSWFDKYKNSICYQFDSNNGGSRADMYDWLTIGELVSDVNLRGIESSFPN